MLFLSFLFVIGWFSKKSLSNFKIHKKYKSIKNTLFHMNSRTIATSVMKARYIVVVVVI